jgi:hypothetical protein
MVCYLLEHMIATNTTYDEAALEDDLGEAIFLRDEYINDYSCKIKDVTDETKILKKQIDDLKKKKIDILFNNLNQHSLRPILLQNKYIKTEIVTGNIVEEIKLTEIDQES